MQKRLLFFLILYLTGMAMSPILAGEALPGKKNFLYSLEEGGLGEGENLHEWSEKLPDFPSLSSAHRFNRSDFFSFFQSTGLVATQSTEGCSCPLYLLFQSLLFYDHS